MASEGGNVTNQLNNELYKRRVQEMRCYINIQYAKLSQESLVSVTSDNDRKNHHVTKLVSNTWTPHIKRSLFSYCKTRS